MEVIMKKYITLLSLLFVGISALGADDQHLKPLQPNNNPELVARFRTQAVPAKMVNGKIVFMSMPQLPSQTNDSEVLNGLSLADLVRRAEQRKTKK